MQLRGLVVHNGLGDADLNEPIEKFSRQKPACCIAADVDDAPT